MEILSEFGFSFSATFIRGIRENNYFTRATNQNHIKYMWFDASARSKYISQPYILSFSSHTDFILCSRRHNFVISDQFPFKACCNSSELPMK